MTRIVTYALLSLLLIGGSFAVVFGQSRAELEKKQRELNAAIQFNTQQLQKIGDTKKQSLSQLELLVTQIQTREQVITNLSKQVSVLSGSINETDGIITSLETDLKNLKHRYADLLYYAYKHRSTLNDVIFVFSSTSFNDAWRRIKYLHQLAEFRKRQVDLISLTKESLNNRVDALEDQRKTQQKLLDEQVGQRQKLQTERNQRNDLVASLLTKEKKIKREIETQRKNAELLNKKIAAIIESIRLAELNKKKPTDMVLSGLFAENKGKLPMPVGKGVITSSFGRHPHPVYGDRLMIDNKGIDIRTNENAPVTAIFDGEVISILSNPAFQRAVVVKHGEYFTVYTKLSTVSVKVGDKIKTGQSIGVAYTDVENATTEVHFELWMGENNLNPSLWISTQ